MLAEDKIQQEVPSGRMVLRTENLVKKYGKRTVVSHVSFDVKQGEIVGLLGPNGAGKTTSFYMTTGLVVPNEGHIYLNDLDITNYPVYKRAQNGIGYLAQEASVFRKMSVEDNIASVLELTNRSKEYQKEKLESLIAEFRLQKVRKNLGDQLSGGERRRTEIARCLAIDPKFIMLDEPFAGVDPIAVEDIQHIVWKLKDKNIGILITDHNVQETLSITDRAYLLFEGKILFQGTPEELAENKIVREKYLSNSFVLRRKDFQLKEDITNYPVYKRAQNGIGYLAQEASVFRKMSVEDNIASVLELTNRSKEYQKEKLESLIAEFRLQKVRKNLGDQLSGGERRRTEIARCLAIDPKFIMLDEPFAGVDPIAVEDIQHIVWKLKDKNIGILITDHNVQETLSITDRAYLLFEGKILFQGTPEELAENKIVREKYLSNSFVLRRKDFQLKEVKE